MQNIKTYYGLDITPCGDNITSVQQPVPSDANSLYPVPAYSSITLHSSSATVQQYFICDVAGQIIQRGSTSGTDSQIDISQLAPGIYFLRSGSDMQTKTMKFVKAQ